MSVSLVGGAILVGGCKEWGEVGGKERRGKGGNLSPTRRHTINRFKIGLLSLIKSKYDIYKPQADIAKRYVC